MASAIACCCPVAVIPVIVKSNANGFGRGNRNGGKVYIHCSAGVGRAPTMAAAYFLSRGHTLDEAIGMIKQVRPFINIMTPQMELLQKMEAEHESGVFESTPADPPL